MGQWLESVLPRVLSTVSWTEVLQGRLGRNLLDIMIVRGGREGMTPIVPRLGPKPERSMSSHEDIETKTTESLNKADVFK